MAGARRERARPILHLLSSSMAPLNTGESALGPNPSGFIERPAPARKPYEVIVLEAGWGTDPGLRTVGWGGPDHEWDAFIIDAPIIVERADAPNQDTPRHHGRKTYFAGRPG